MQDWLLLAFSIKEKGKVLKLKAQCFHTKLPYQKAMLRQTKWEVQNGLITKDGVLPVTTLFFLKIFFQRKNLN